MIILLLAVLGLLPFAFAMLVVFLADTWWWSIPLFVLIMILGIKERS